MVAEFYCIQNDAEFASLTVDGELSIMASTPSDVELIFMFCQEMQTSQKLLIK